MPGSNRLVIAVGSHVVALDPATGTELWRTRLKNTSFVTVREASGRIFAGAGGELFCLDHDGTILWRNRLKGLGIGVVAFSGSDESVGQAALAAQRQAAAAG